MIRLILLLSILLFSINSYGQSAANIKMRDALKKEMKKGGYTLVDEGGSYIKKSAIIATDKRYYTSNQEILVVAVADCTNCDLRIKFGQPGQIPTKLPNKRTNQKKVWEHKLTLVSFRGKAEYNGEGYFMLFNQSSKKCYAYLMLFKK